MATTYTPDSLRNLFQSSFNLAQWYSFLQHFFNATELKSTPERIIENTSDDENIYVVGAKNGNKIGAMITYYTENDNENGRNVEINVDGADVSKAKIYLFDESHTFTPYTKTAFENGKLQIRLERNSIIYIEA